MRRRDLLRRAGIGAGTLVAAGFAGCSGDGDDSDPTPLPEIQVSGEVESTVDGLSITDYEHGLRRGRAHDDVHFSVTPTVENTGDQQAELDNYEYDITLYDANDIDITPGDTFASRGDELSPGESGTVQVEVSFLNAESASPEDIARYELSISCDGSGSYC